MIPASLFEGGKATNVWINPNNILFVKPDNLDGKRVLKVFMINGNYINILDGIQVRKQIDCVEK